MSALLVLVVLYLCALAALAFLPKEATQILLTATWAILLGAVVVSCVSGVVG